MDKIEEEKLKKKSVYLFPLYILFAILSKTVYKEDTLLGISSHIWFWFFLTLAILFFFPAFAWIKHLNKVKKNHKRIHIAFF
jgi:hypothetical protein